MSKALHALLSAIPFVGLLAPTTLFGWQSIRTGAISETTVNAVTATPQGEFLIATDTNLVGLSREGKVVSQTPWQPPIDEGVSIRDIGAGEQGEVIIVLGTKDGILQTQSFGKAPVAVAQRSDKSCGWDAKLISTPSGWLLVALETGSRDLQVWRLDHSGKPVSPARQLWTQVNQALVAPRPGGAMIVFSAFSDKKPRRIRQTVHNRIVSNAGGVFTALLNHDGLFTDDPLLIKRGVSDGSMDGLFGSQPHLLCYNSEAGDIAQEKVCIVIDDQGVPGSQFSVTPKDPKGLIRGDRLAAIRYGEDWLAVMA